MLRDIYWGYRYFRTVRGLPRLAAWAAAKRLAGYVETIPALRDTGSPMFRPAPPPMPLAEVFAWALIIWCGVLVGSMVGPVVASHRGPEIHVK